MRSGSFSMEYAPTIGARFMVLDAPAGTLQVKLELWDCCGQERYLSLLPMYYRGAACVVLVYDVTDSEGLVYLFKIREAIRSGAPMDVKLILCGNKSDVKDRGPKGVTRAQGLDLAKTNGFDAFIEVSALTGKNIPQLSHAIGTLVLENIDRNPRSSACRRPSRPPPKEKCLLM
ncbi:small GTP-binding protein [Pelomyxa schiedti]|nr:small GTP-binding protein [Pelomyxa schiedti]